MAIETYFLYLLVAVGYIASPGPAVVLAINCGVQIGIRKTALTLLGNTTGLGVLALVAASGVGALVVNSPIAWMALKICGAIWLFYLGLRVLMSVKSTTQINQMQSAVCPVGTRALFTDGFMLAVTNPKPIVFFLSIYPQFIILNGKEAYQFLWLGISFLLLSFAILSCYSIFSNFIARWVLTANGIKIFNISFGAFFILLAIFLLMSSGN